MRLRSVWISHYKNLRDFSIGFDGDGFIDIFVGKNGSGKSNFLEALIEIFDHIFYFDPDATGPGFDYAISFEIAGAETRIEWRDSLLKINDDAGRRTIGATPLPDNVLVYYSGQNYNVTALVARYEERYRRALRRADATMLPRFVGIGPACKKLLIVVLMLLPEHSLARSYLCQRLGILSNRRMVRIVLKRPSFAGKEDVDPFDEQQRFWGTTGVVRTFLDQLVECMSGEFTLGSIYDRDNDRYVLECNLDAFREAHGDLTAETIFRSFDALRVVGMLEDISITIALDGLEVTELNHFSDGQFQSVYVFAVSELFKQRNCLILLDEPDAFLHPEWQFDFLDQVSAISAEAAKTNHILLSSHSASTVAAQCDSRIRLFSSGPEGVTAEQTDKSSIVNSLSAGLITLSETEAALSIEQTLASSGGAVLFTEGISDALILRLAWDKLYPSRTRPFAIEQGYGSSVLRNMLTNTHLYDEHPDRLFFALFDFDEAYKDWNQFGQVVQDDPALCLVKQWQGRNGYGVLLPVPSTLSVRGQVIKPDGSGNFGDKSRLSIELMFRDVPQLTKNFEPDLNERDACIRFVGEKVAFARQVVPNLEPQYFDPFRPVFDFILGKIGVTGCR